MARRRRVAATPDAVGTQLTMRLFDPGMSPVHRAGLGGLACTLRYVENAYRKGTLGDRDVPGGPWHGGVGPPWSIGPAEVTLRFGEPANAAKFLNRLFSVAFSLRDGLIFLPPQHRRDPPLDVLAQLQNGLTLTLLQHGKVRSLEKAETFISCEVDGHPLSVPVKLCTGYKHQEGWRDLCDSSGRLTARPVEVVGPLNPGAAVRHKAYQAQTRIEEQAKLVLPLYFALVGCLALPINRKSAVLLVPDVKDLDLFSKVRAWMTPTNAAECRIAGAGDAALQAQVRLKASGLMQRHGIAGCQVITFQSMPWASQQKSRVAVAYVPAYDAERLRLFEIALAELPPRLIPTRHSKAANTQRSDDAEAQWFWVDSVVRPLVAENLAAGLPWYKGFAKLMRMADPRDKQPIRDRLKFEKGGLYGMVEKIPWQQGGEGTLVQALHEALRMRYGRIAEENKGKAARTNRSQREYETWRLAFSGAKTADQFRHSLCDLFARAGSNRVLKEKWAELLPMLDAGRWQLARDLALLALASYKGKGTEDEGMNDKPEGDTQ